MLVGDRLAEVNEASEVAIPQLMRFSLGDVFAMAEDIAVIGQRQRLEYVLIDEQNVFHLLRPEKLVRFLRRLCARREWSRARLRVTDVDRRNLRLNDSDWQRQDSGRSQRALGRQPTQTRLLIHRVSSV